ncbi:hypothetical protein T265_05859 [Opisthorchis viverrini]|uniref:Uncharacterized protein n=1 Tax=Opisthorchis viverrini TaxID=6198 RepID=A0A074ZI79_OPIVI|nr:hypothetical protein T265_05859 [Opisthorchis viverrini]KER27028.1 hypothetical protein T265_05859 [Opisthorchis viverrini]
MKSKKAVNSIWKTWKFRLTETRDIAENFWKHGNPRPIRLPKHLKWTQYHYMQRTNYFTRILKGAKYRIHKPRIKKSLESDQQRSQPEPRWSNDEGHSSTDQSTRKGEARHMGHVVIDQSGHRITEQPLNRPNNRVRRPAVKPPPEQAD